MADKSRTKLIFWRERREREKGLSLGEKCRGEGREQQTSDRDDVAMRDIEQCVATGLLSIL